MNRRTDASERYAARKRQEDEAPRLKEIVPNVTACKVEVVEKHRDTTVPDVSHTRHIVVAHAPALLVIPCCDPSCRDGGHDVTTQLLRGLREGRPVFEGDDVCRGSIGSVECGRTLHFTARATYEDPK